MDSSGTGPAGSDTTPRTDLAAELMTGFARRTGLTGENAVSRYLWTDSFALCNLLGLHRATGDPRWVELADRLVRQVHHTLGRHRDDDPRTGWISGLDEAEGERHPTRGGLRIGKKLPERRPGEPADSRREWERDGQYFHYLTRWMHALARYAEETDDDGPHRWAVELATAAHDAFVVRDDAGRPTRMVWKTSIDLSRPLVPSMGQHDPLDGLVTYRDLATGGPDGDPPLDTRIAEMATLCAGGRLVTDDPLGLGGLLTAAWRIGRQASRGAGPRGELLTRILAAARDGLAEYERYDPLGRPPEFRLPFRELGLAIGLRAVERLDALLRATPDLFRPSLPPRPAVDAVTRFLPLAERIEATWRDSSAQEGGTWSDHREINTVMLATSLLPDGHLG